MIEKPKKMKSIHQGWVNLEKRHSFIVKYPHTIVVEDRSFIGKYPHTIVGKVWHGSGIGQTYNRLRLWIHNKLTYWQQFGTPWYRWWKNLTSL
jgi:hypothetical protein